MLSVIENKEKPAVEYFNFREKNKLSPLLKWAGGKEQELKFIVPNLPTSFTNYYEPFVGGGAVYTALTANEYFINDRSNELISLYKSISNDNRDDLFKVLREIIHNWKVLTDVLTSNKLFFLDTYLRYSSTQIDINQVKDILYEFILKHGEQFNGLFSTIFNFDIENFIKEIKINLIRKIKRMRILELQKCKLPERDILDNIETALKSAFYMHFRHLYNNQQKYPMSESFKTAVFLFIRNYAYSGMFRYNSRGDFNVPYGGIGYNNKNFEKKIEYLESSELLTKLKNTTIENEDFEQFLTEHTPTETDFVFLDPPYDTEFSTYAKNTFDKDDHTRLANYLITQCKAKWMLIIKNTPFINQLYNNKNLNIKSFDKKYLVSFMNRNDKDVEHLLIRNY